MIEEININVLIKLRQVDLYIFRFLEQNKTFIFEITQNI